MRIVYDSVKICVYCAHLLIYTFYGISVPTRRTAAVPKRVPALKSKYWRYLSTNFDTNFAFLTSATCPLSPTDIFTTLLLIYKNSSVSVSAIIDIECGWCENALSLKKVVEQLFTNFETDNLLTYEHYKWNKKFVFKNKLIQLTIA